MGTVNVTLSTAQQWLGKTYQPGTQDVPTEMARALGLWTAPTSITGEQVDLYITTADDTATDMLRLDGDSKYLIPSGKAAVFNGRVWGQVDGTHDIGGWTFSGAIANNAGTTALSGAITPVALPGLPAGWALAITADDTNDALNLEVTGVAATDIIWKGQLDILTDDIP